MIPNILLLAIQKANGTVTNEVFNAAPCYWGTTVGLGGVVGKALPFEFL